MNKYEEKIYSLKTSRDNYRRLYEKEKKLSGNKVVLSETDITMLFKIQEFVDDMIGRWRELERSK